MSSGLEMKVEQVSREKFFITAFAAQPVTGVRLHVRLQRSLLVKLFPAFLADVLLLAGVDEGVPLEAGGVRERLRAFLTDEGAEGGLPVVVEVPGQVLGQHLLSALWTEHGFFFC